MCSVCGCGEGEFRVRDVDSVDKKAPQQVEGDQGNVHQHGVCEDAPSFRDEDSRAFSLSREGDHLEQEPVRVHAPGMSQSRMLQVERGILAKNNQYANANRTFFQSRGIFTLNLVSSPGSGKTTILEKTLLALKGDVELGVIEGDQQTLNDAQRIRATGVKAVQVNTGRGCHLDGHMVGHAVEKLIPAEESFLFIENVGNLVCPAAFDLGETYKVVILSVTEGDDKPIKYPDMFHAADLMLLNKVDLLEHLDFSTNRCIENARSINPALQILEVSAVRGTGMEDFFHWLKLARQLFLVGCAAFRRSK